MHRSLAHCARSAWMLALLLVLWTGMAHAETWYVKSSETRMTVSPDFRSRVLGNLSAGQAVEVVEDAGRYYKISVGGTQGYVFKFKLTQEPPAGGAVSSRSSGTSKSSSSGSQSSGSSGGGGLDALLGSPKMAASESSSASSIRGLSPISEQYGKGQGISQANINAVVQMENFKVSPSEVDRFQQEGGLGRRSK